VGVLPEDEEVLVELEVDDEVLVEVEEVTLPEVDVELEVELDVLSRHCPRSSWRWRSKHCPTTSWSK